MLSRRMFLLVALTATACVLVCGNPAVAADFWMESIQERERLTSSSTGSVEYFWLGEVGKAGEDFSSVKLEFDPGKDGTYETTYNLTLGGGDWWEYESGDYSSLNDLSVAVVGNWRLTITRAGETDTVYTFTHGSLAEGDYLDLPAITDPNTKGADVTGDYTFTWTHDGYANREFYAELDKPNFWRDTENSGDEGSWTVTGIPNGDGEFLVGYAKGDHDNISDWSHDGGTDLVGSDYMGPSTSSEYVTLVPEPATMLLLCGAAAPVLLKRRRKA